MLDLFGAGRLLRLRLGRCNGIALSLNSLDHPQDEFEALQLTENFCLKVKWQCVAIGCAQSLEPLHPFGMHGFIVIDTVDGEESFDSVDMLDTFVDQPAAFPVKPTIVLFDDSRDTDDAPNLRLAAQIRHQ